MSLCWIRIQYAMLYSHIHSSTLLFFSSRFNSLIYKFHFFVFRLLKLHYHIRRNFTIYSTQYPKRCWSVFLWTENTSRNFKLISKSPGWRSKWAPWSAWMIWRVRCIGGPTIRKTWRTSCPGFESAKKRSSNRSASTMLMNWKESCRSYRWGLSVSCFFRRRCCCCCFFVCGRLAH